MPNGQVPVVDIVDLVLYSLCVELSLFFSFSFVVFLLVALLFSCVTTLLGEVGKYININKLFELPRFFHVMAVICALLSD